MKTRFASFLWLTIIQFGLIHMAYGTKLCHVTNVSTDDVLNVRTSAGAHNPAIGSFAHNTKNLSLYECHLYERSNWCLVSNASRSVSGWVAARFLDCEENQSLSSPHSQDNGAEIEQWCQNSPYCHITFAGKTFYFPIGWKVTNFFKGSQGQIIMQSERQSDGIRSWLNENKLEQVDCGDYPNGHLCFDPSFQPITEQERNILGGKPNAPLILPALDHSELLSQNVDIVVKPVEKIAGLNYWSIQSVNNNSYLANLDQKFIYPENRVALDFITDREGRIRVDTNVVGQYIFSAFTRNDKLLFDVILEVLPTPKEQCFLIPNWTSGNLIDFERQLQTYHLPHYFSKENGDSGYNDGNQPLTEGIIADDQGHGPDTSYILAPVPCERL